MQLQDAFFKDIHWFRYSQKKADSFYPNRFIFHKTYSMPSNAEDLYQYVERTFPNHAVDLVYYEVADSPQRYFKLGLECSSC
jgi:hypothetical protein